MKRRSFLRNALGVLVSLVTGHIAVARLHTDADYADVKDATSRGNFYPYLDGKICTRVQRANAVEGWIDHAVIDPSTKMFLHGSDGETLSKRFYGRVQLLRANPERRGEFMAALAAEGRAF